MRQLRSGWFRYKEAIKTVIHYYISLRFCFVDLLLSCLYLWKNPYKVYRDFFGDKEIQQKDPYGETPLTTMDKIATLCHIQSKDTVYELGSGNGRTCFWLASFVECSVVGYERHPVFVTRSEAIARWAPWLKVSFRESDYLEIDFSGASVVYLYGTTLPDALIEKLCAKLKSLPKGGKVITVSYPLSDFSSGFSTVKTFEASFPWGKTLIYLNRVS